MKEQSNKQKSYTRQSAAQLLGVSVVTVDRELAKNRMPHFRIGRRVLFTDEHLDEYIRRNTKNTKMEKSCDK